DAERGDAVMESVERRRFEQAQPFRNDSTVRREGAVEPASKLHVDTVQQQMPTAKAYRIVSEFIEGQARAGIIPCDDGAGADSDHHVDVNTLAHQRAEDADMCGAAEAAGTEHDRNARSRAQLRVVGHVT